MPFNLSGFPSNILQPHLNSKMWKQDTIKFWTFEKIRIELSSLLSLPLLECTPPGRRRRNTCWTCCRRARSRRSQVHLKHFSLHCVYAVCLYCFMCKRDSKQPNGDSAGSIVLVLYFKNSMVILLKYRLNLKSADYHEHKHNV